MPVAGPNCPLPKRRSISLASGATHDKIAFEAAAAVAWTIAPSSPTEPMKLVSALLFSLFLGASVLAQDLPRQDAAKARATVEGIVTKDPDGQPVKKTLIELIAENQAEAGNYTAITGSEGAFRIENILPGR